MTVSAEIFFQAASVAWQQLPSSARKAVRAASRGGRQLHDSLLTHLRLNLEPPRIASVALVGDEVVVQDEEAQAPSQAELRSCVTGVLQRGAKLQALKLTFLGTLQQGGALPPAEREGQLLAVLDTVRGCPPPALNLAGGIPISVSMAEAVATCCPTLTKLTLDFAVWCNDLPPKDSGEEAANAYTAGVVRLLSGVGPRLRELRVVRSAHHWPVEAWGALRHCTGLTALTVEAGWTNPDDKPFQLFLGSAQAQEAIISTACELTSLQSLSLLVNLGPAHRTLPALTPQAPALARLSALTALTSLKLDLAASYDPRRDSWLQRESEGTQHAAWCELRETHLTSLLSALRAMPQLQYLACPTLWLKPSEMASLTSLTTLSLAGLLPQPTPGGADAGDAIAAAAAPATTASQAGAWPPQLQELAFTSGASPRALSALRLPDSLRTFSCTALRLGISDVVEGGSHLRPESIEALAPAVQLLVRTKPTNNVLSISVVVDGARGMLQPRVDSADGHAEWLEQLAGLDAFFRVELRGGVTLRVGDVECLVRALPGVQCLELRDVWMPVSSLPSLAGLTRAKSLTADLSRVGDVMPEELEAAVCLLCKQASSELWELNVITESTFVNINMCQAAVMRQLGAWGRAAMSIKIGGYGDGL